MDFKTELKAYRLKHNLTQHSMGYRLGCVTSTHICNIETGKRKATSEMKAKFKELKEKGNEINTNSNPRSFQYQFLLCRN